MHRLRRRERYLRLRVFRGVHRRISPIACLLETGREGSRIDVCDTDTDRRSRTGVRDEVLSQRVGVFDRIGRIDVGENHELFATGAGGDGRRNEHGVDRIRGRAQHDIAVGVA